MSSDNELRPPGALAVERPSGAPHLVDYWRVVTRRSFLVGSVFLVTAASTLWAVSRQPVVHRGTMTLQVSDPLERQRGLVGTRVSGMDIFVDPIESEIQVLRSSAIASSVVTSLGLRLRRIPAEEPRSALFVDAWVADEAPTSRYDLVYAADGTTAHLRSGDGEVIGTAPVGDVLDAGIVRFTLSPPPGDARTYPIEVVPAPWVSGEIAIAASPRQNTNIIDVSLLHPDPDIAAKALHSAGNALREKGADRVRRSARADIDFINERLRDARGQLEASMTAIRDFKKTQEFTNLGARERSLLDRSDQVSEDIEALDAQRAHMVSLLARLARTGIEGIDIAATLAEIPEGGAPEVRAMLARIQDEQAEARRLVAEDRKSPEHPHVVASRAEIHELGDQLYDAAFASVRYLESRLDELGGQQAGFLAQQREFPDLEGELQALEAQRTLDRETYQFLLSQLYQAQITEAAASPYVEILDPATSYQVDGRGRVNVLLGALLGLILGLGSAFFVEYLDRTVRTTADVESILGIPVLGVIPRLHRREQSPSTSSREPLPPPLVATDPLDPGSEAYRNLRMNLVFMGTEDEPMRSILFTSPGPSEGKSTTAINVAVVLAQQGHSVLMVDADLRRPSLHRALEVSREPGLTNLLVGNATAREAVRSHVLPGLDFLPSGPFPPNPSELLNSRAMARLMDELGSRYDHVVIDSPPVLAVTDASVLAGLADGTALVLRSGETDQRASDRAIDQLRRLGVRVFGAVLNEVTLASSDDYYLRYYYAYHRSSGGGGFQRLREGLPKVRFFS